MSDVQLAAPRIAPDLPPSSDPLGEVLQLLQMTGVLYCNAELTDPWGIEIPALPGVMNVEVVTSGHCWIELEGEAPVFMPRGSLLLIPRGNRHILRGNPGDKTTALEDIPVERIGDRFENMHFGGGGRPTQITYYGVRFDPYLADRLIGLLPKMLHLRTHVDDGSWLHSTIRFIAQEARQRLPGSETVITRLADILVIQAIRTWLDTEREEQRGWIAALHDRHIGKAMSLMHRQPERDWRNRDVAIGFLRTLHRAGGRAGPAIPHDPAHATRTPRVARDKRHACQNCRARRLPVRARIQSRVQARGRHATGRYTKNARGALARIFHEGFASQGTCA
jgi:Cupin